MIDNADSQSQNHAFHQEENSRLDLCCVRSGCSRAFRHSCAYTLQGKLLGVRLKLTTPFFRKDKSEGKLPRKHTRGKQAQQVTYAGIEIYSLDT